MTTLPEALRKKIEAKAAEEVGTKYGIKTYDFDMRVEKFVAGAEALWQILVEGGVEFLEKDESAFRYWADCNSEPSSQLDDLQSFSEGRRYQHAQLTAHYEAELAERDAAISQLKESEARLKAEIEQLKDCKHPGCCCVCGHQGECPECGLCAAGFSDD